MTYETNKDEPIKPSRYLLLQEHRRLSATTEPGR